MSDSVRPHRWQPTRLPHPWDSLGKNTAVGCYFLLQCMKVKSESEVAQSCPTLSDPMDCSLPGSSIHGIFQGAPPFQKWSRRKLKVNHWKSVTLWDMVLVHSEFLLLIVVNDILKDHHKLYLNIYCIIFTMYSYGLEEI